MGLPVCQIPKAHAFYLQSELGPRAVSRHIRCGLGEPQSVGPGNHCLRCAEENIGFLDIPQPSTRTSSTLTRTVPAEDRGLQQAVSGVLPASEGGASGRRAHASGCLAALAQAPIFRLLHRAWPTPRRLRRIAGLGGAL